MNWTEVAALLSPIILVAGIIGGYFSLRSSLAKSQSEISAQVREDLQAENELLRARVLRVERENKRLDKLMLLVVDVLKKTQGIDLKIDDDMVTLRAKGVTHVSRITTGGLVQ